MSIQDDIKNLKDEMGIITSHLKDESIRRVKKKSWRLPFGIKIKGRRAIKQGKFLAIILRSNHKLEFKVVNVISGLIMVDDTSYKAYEDGAVYFYKKFPVVVILDWRLTLVGGMTDFDNANDLNIGAFADKTMIRIIEKIEVDKNDGKKKGKFSIGLIIVVIGILIYIVSQGIGV